MVNVINLKTKIFFGKRAIDFLGRTLKEHQVKKVMIVYGGGSILKNGVYDDTVSNLKENGIDYVEYKGVKPNPEAKHTYQGALFARQSDVDAVVAVGGGSVTDAAKVMAILATNPNYQDCWSYVLNPSKVTNPAIPVYSVITTAGTASENNSGSVITNEQTKEKLGVFTPSATPVAAILDPTYLYTLSPWQTASGIFDCFSHLLEQYYDVPSMEWTKQYIFANLRTLLKYAQLAIEEPCNYTVRANVQITTTMALNGLASFASKTDWKVHAIEHAISGLWDVAHGAGLALVTPTYIRYRCQNEPAFAAQTCELGEAIFQVRTVDEFLDKLIGFIKSINLPVKFTDFHEIKEVTEQDRALLYEYIVSPIGAKSRIDQKYWSIIKNVISLIP